MIEWEIAAFGLVSAGLFSAGRDDWKKGRVFPASIGFVIVGGLVHATMSAAYINHWLPLVIAVTLYWVFLGTGFLIQRFDAWSTGDTLLFAATGLAVWQAPVNYLLLVAVFGAAWIFGLRDRGPFAPVYAVAFIVWLALT